MKRRTWRLNKTPSSVSQFQQNRTFWKFDTKSVARNPFFALFYDTTCCLFRIFVSFYELPRSVQRVPVFFSESDDESRSLFWIIVCSRQTQKTRVLACSVLLRWATGLFNARGSQHHSTNGNHYLYLMRRHHWLFWPEWAPASVVYECLTRSKTINAGLHIAHGNRNWFDVQGNHRNWFIERVVQPQSLVCLMTSHQCLKGNLHCFFSTPGNHRRCTHIEKTRLWPQTRKSEEKASKPKAPAGLI